MFILDYVHILCVHYVVIINYIYFSIIRTAFLIFRRTLRVTLILILTALGVTLDRRRRRGSPSHSHISCVHLNKAHICLFSITYTSYTYTHCNNYLLHVFLTYIYTHCNRCLFVCITSHFLLSISMSMEQLFPNCIIIRCVIY